MRARRTHAALSILAVAEGTGPDFDRHPSHRHCQATPTPTPTPTSRAVAGERAAALLEVNTQRDDEPKLKEVAAPVVDRLDRQLALARANVSKALGRSLAAHGEPAVAVEEPVYG